MRPSETPDGLQGRRLAGRYRLAELVGSGGAGNVWAAVDEVLERRVAVKDVGAPPWLSVEGWEALRERTLREARAAAVIGHPNVVTVYDVVEEDDRPWIVMQLVEARTLSQIIDEDGPCTPRRAAEIGLQILAALQAAHDHGILHRDVKPSNVLVRDDGHAVLTDFGIASVDGDVAITQSGVLVGAPAYIAPERVQGGTAGPASDLWSLGATLYTSVEGRPPYRRDGAITTIAAVVHDEPDPTTNAGPLRPLLDALLRRDPEQRPSAAEVERYLRAVAASDQDVETSLATLLLAPTSTAPVPVVGGALAVPALAGAAVTAPAVGVLAAVTDTGPRTPALTTGPNAAGTAAPAATPEPTRRDRQGLRSLALLTVAAAALFAILMTGYLTRNTMQTGVPSQLPGSEQRGGPEPVADIYPNTSQPRERQPAGGPAATDAQQQQQEQQDQQQLHQQANPSAEATQTHTTAPSTQQPPSSSTRTSTAAPTTTATEPTATVTPSPSTATQAEPTGTNAAASASALP